MRRSQAKAFLEGINMANMSNEEQIGIHKGALSVLVKEREEFIRILQVVEQLMQVHIKALKDLGLDLEAEAKKAMESMKQSQQKQPSGDIGSKFA